MNLPKRKYDNFEKDNYLTTQFEKAFDKVVPLGATKTEILAKASTLKDENVHAGFLYSIFFSQVQILKRRSKSQYAEYLFFQSVSQSFKNEMVNLRLIS